VAEHFTHRSTCILRERKGAQRDSREVQGAEEILERPQRKGNEDGAGGALFPVRPKEHVRKRFPAGRLFDGKPWAWT